MDRQLSKDDLITLLGNCIIALAFAQNNNPKTLFLARKAADKHIRELDQRFPDWRDTFVDH